MFFACRSSSQPAKTAEAIASRTNGMMSETYRMAGTSRKANFHRIRVQRLCLTSDFRRRVPSVGGYNCLSGRVFMIGYVERLEGRRMLADVVGLDLINAQTDQPVAGFSLVDGAVIDLAQAG